MGSRGHPELAVAQQSSVNLDAIRIHSDHGKTEAATTLERGCYLILGSAVGQGLERDGCCRLRRQPASHSALTVFLEQVVDAELLAVSIDQSVSPVRDHWSFQPFAPSAARQL